MSADVSQHILIDDAAETLAMALPDGFAQAHAGLLAAAVVDTGWTLDDARKYAELEFLLPVDASRVEKPWSALQQALRGSYGAGEGQARAAALAALDELRGILGGVAEDATFEADDLTTVDAAAPFTYAPGDLAHRVVLGDGLTTFAGHGGSGKSTVAQALALDAMRGRKFVLHLDYEQGKERTARKYRALGATTDDLTGSLAYVWRPGKITFDRLHELADGRDVFVLVDSFSKAAAAAGLNGTDWSGHGDFASMLNAFSVDTGSPVLLLDHLAKSEGKNARWGDGAHQKYDAARGQWTVSIDKPFRDDQLGGILMINSKDNDSALDTHVRLALGGDGQDRINLRRVGQGDIPALKIELDVVAFLTEQDEPQPLSAICKAVKGNDAVITATVKRLAEDDAAHVHAVTDGRWTKYTAE